jgi:hypothetical protein
MKQSIYKSWNDCFSKFFWIDLHFSKKEYDEIMYNAALKTMRYISSYMKNSDTDFKKELKSDLKEVREYYLSMVSPS